MFTNLFAKKPRSQAARIMPANVEFHVAPKETLLQAALNQGIAFPHDCRAGGCGTCKCRLLKGTVKELTDKSYLLSAEELRDNYVLACQSIPRSDVEVDVELRDASTLASPQRSTARITRMDRLTHDIVHLTVDLEQGLAFTPGQYCELTARAGSAAGVTRRYSFANVPEASGTSRRAEFFIRKVPGGRFTEWLFEEASSGDVLEVTGPFGDFMLRESSAPMLCIAGGSGLAPVLSMLQGMFPEMSDYTLDNEIYVIKDNGIVIGYAYIATGKGYAGNIDILIGLEDAETVKGISIVKHSESPGLGARIVEDAYKNQYNDLKITDSDMTFNGGNIDSITGATISSRAVADAVRVTALEKVREIFEGGD